MMVSREDFLARGLLPLGGALQTRFALCKVEGAADD
jgi:hypothetical protein